MKLTPNEQRAYARGYAAGRKFVERTATVLATPASAANLPQPPRRGELSREEREGLVFYLEDYAEMLECCAVGIDDVTDADTMKRIRAARELAQRVKQQSR